MAFSSSLNMINITVIAVFFSLSILTAECRPQNFDLVKSIAGNKNDDWKNDKDYTFKWEGKLRMKFKIHWITLIIIPWLLLAKHFV